MQNWIVDGEPNEIAFELIYRGSRDGFEKQKFNSLLQGKGPTLTIVETVEHSQRFGGFTQIPWNFNDQFTTNDPKAFIFSLDNMKKYKINDQKQVTKGYKTSGMLVKFGGGSDFIIYENGN